MNAACTYWFTGLSGAGKTTLATALQERLQEMGIAAVRLDGDELRNGPNLGLGYSESDREEHVRRTASLARILNSQGFVVLASLIAPTHRLRQVAKEWVGQERYVEVFVNAPIEVCAARDVKGLYAKAHAGHLSGFTGVSAPYEPPTASDLTLCTDAMTIEQCLAHLLKWFAPAPPRGCPP